MRMAGERRGRGSRAGRVHGELGVIHRPAVVLSWQCSTGTLDYILQRCQLALQNVLNELDNGDVSLKSLEPAVLKKGEDIHNEVRMAKKLMGLRLTPACSFVRV